MKFFVKQKARITLCIAVLTLGTQGGAWADDDIERIVFFGDSLSDAGNIYALTGQVTTPPWPLVPAAPYDFGNGFQFSNDKTWPQYFARRLETSRSGRASLLNPEKNSNYAFGGARLGTGLEDPTSAASQVAWYLADNGGDAGDDETLHVLQFGGNDLRDALLDPPNAVDIVMQAANKEIELIRDLHAAGARRFLVADAPDLGKVPVIRVLEASAEGTALSGLFNFLLESGLQSLEDPELGLKDVSIARLSFFTLLNAIIDDPGKYGIENTTGTCLQTLPPGSGVCPDPDVYLFWDGLHPTGEVHKIVGRQAAADYLEDDDDSEDDDD